MSIRATCFLQVIKDGWFVASQLKCGLYCYLVGDASLQSLEQRGFAMEAAAHDERNARPDAHAQHCAAVRQVHPYLQGGRGLERHSLLAGKRLVRCSTGPA